MKIIRLKRFISALTILLLILPIVSFTNKSNHLPRAPRTIVIDAGHGGPDGATRGLYSREKDVTLKVALLLGKTIEANFKDVKVIYTRTEDVLIPLYERMNIATRAKADLFISIHCNDMPVQNVRIGYHKNKKGVRVPTYAKRKDTSTHGVETFVAGSSRLSEQDPAIRENMSILLEKDYKENYEGFDPNDPASRIILDMMKNSFRDQSIKFATLLQKEYVKTGRVDRGVQEQSLAVLRHATMPGVLTEIGFICNPEEEDYMNSQTGQNEIVTCLLNAIQAYFKQSDAE
jgi:N-acetylmuramoyl-L-alanine amidase